MSPAATDVPGRAAASAALRAASAAYAWRASENGNRSPAISW